MAKFRMPSPLPLFVNPKKHDTIAISSLVIATLQLGHVYLVNASVSFKDGPCLRVKTTHDDGLVHTFECHSEKEKTSDLYITREVYKDFTKSRNLWFVIGFSKGRTHSHGSCCLQVFDSVANVPKLWRLDCSSQDLFWLIGSPQLNLKNQFLKRASLHLRLGVFWDTVLIK
jgi:hypothetical protein